MHTIEHSRFYRTKSGEIRLVIGFKDDETLYLTYGSEEAGIVKGMRREEFAESIDEQIPTPMPPSVH